MMILSVLPTGARVSPSVTITAISSNLSELMSRPEIKKIQIVVILEFLIYGEN